MLVTFGHCRIFSCALLLLSLTACGVIKDRSNEYLLVEDGKELVVPPWYRQDKVAARYPVPEITQQRALPKAFVLPGPPDGTAAVSDEPYVIESIAAQTWLHLYTSPGKVWPLLDFFWREYNITTAQEDIASGFVVTDVLSKDAIESLVGLRVIASDFPEFARIQAKVNQGVRRNTAELQVRIVPELQGNITAGQWRESSEYREYESSLLERIGQYVTSETVADRYSLLANDIGGGSLVRMLEDEAGLSYIEMQLSYQRAWSEIEQALASAGVVVSDRDRSERVFYISYLSEDEFSSWLPFRNNDEKRKEQNLSLEFFVRDDGAVVVRARPIAPGWTREQAQSLLNLVFEHVS